MLYDTLKRVIQRKNYNTIDEIKEKVSLLYSAEKITADEYMELMEMIYEGGE